MFVGASVFCRDQFFILSHSPKLHSVWSHLGSISLLYRGGNWFQWYFFSLLEIVLPSSFINQWNMEWV